MGKRKFDKSLLIISCGLVGLCVISAGVLGTVKSHADDVVDQINITVPESCSVDFTITPVEGHTKTVSNNNYYSNIGYTTFKTYCNDNNGYAIYAIGYSNDELGNTLMKHNSNSTYDFDTGTATSGNTSDWAMKLAAISGTYAPTIHSDANGAFTSYHVIPSTYTKVVSFASNTDLPATGINATGSGFTSTYASWISATQPAGTYTGKVIYALVHPASEIPLQAVDCPSGKICYNPNGGNVVGTMGQQSVSASDTSATLLASNFSREGYGFAGWSDVYDYATNSNAHFYGPNEDISFMEGEYTDANDGLALYAVWVKSAGTMQANASSVCNGLNAAVYDDNNDSDESTWSINAGFTSVSALTDQRDNQTYAIAKLADGNCWMIENLRLEAENTRTAEKQALAQGYGTSATYGNFSGLADAESDNFGDVAVFNSIYYSGSQSGGATIDIGTTNEPGFRMPRYNNWNNQSSSTNRPQNPITNTSINGTSNAGMYSYGNYYTWAAAMANTTYYNSFSGTSGSDAANTSLCPANWHLPSSCTTTQEYGALSTSYGGTGSSQSGVADAGDIMSKRFRTFPNNFLYSGYFSGSSTSFRGNNGYYWSRSVSYDINYSYGLYLHPVNFNPSRFGYKSNGFSVRCLISS